MRITCGVRRPASHGAPLGPGVASTMDDEPMTPEEAERAHLRGPEGSARCGTSAHAGAAQDRPRLPVHLPGRLQAAQGLADRPRTPTSIRTFIANHREDDGAHYLG